MIDQGILATPAAGGYAAGTAGTGQGGRVRIEDHTGGDSNHR